MSVITEYLKLSTQGNCQVIDITPEVKDKLSKIAVKSGIVNVSVVGSTGGITTP